ncbi:hypothetical protein ACNQGP_07225 [Flavobacterium sp. GT2N3]|uniref:hypothetical protein n=1 Tax=unclassified Flavobacterium TaxID=196869 RepID=UPI003AAC5E4B
MENKRVKTPGSGRVKGTPNKTTSEARELLQKIVGKELDKLGTLLSGLPPLERVNALAKLLPYILPKKQEVILEEKPPMTEEQRIARMEALKAKLNSSKI